MWPQNCSWKQYYSYSFLLLKKNINSISHRKHKREPRGAFLAPFLYICFFLNGAFWGGFSLNLPREWERTNLEPSSSTLTLRTQWATHRTTWYRSDVRNVAQHPHTLETLIPLKKRLHKKPPQTSPPTDASPVAPTTALKAVPYSKISGDIRHCVTSWRKWLGARD